MKRWMALLLAAVLVFGITACGSRGKDPQPTAATLDPAIKEYAGEWNAEVSDAYVSGGETYQVSSIWLHPDGMGNYNGRAATWAYSQVDHSIHLSIANATTLVLEVAEEEGKTVLKLAGVVYYRASEFEQKK